MDVKQAIRKCKSQGQPATKDGARTAAELLKEKAGNSTTKRRTAQALRFLAKFLPDD